jgi:ribosome-associated translation inhibitor RaiA
MSVEISTTADVPTRDRDRAIDKIDRLVRSIDAPVLHVDIRLTVDHDPARERPAHARVLLNVNGEPIRAHVAAATMDEAIDLLEARLRRRFKSLAEHRQAIRRRGPASPDGEWRHGDLPAERAPFFDRPVDAREIVRHKSFATPDASVDEAIFDLESMDYDFYLFTDAQTGYDAVVWRTDEGTYGLHFANGEVPPVESIVSVAVIELDDRPVPVLTTGEARLALDDTGDPWLVYRDPDNGRARILYRRYDGHYGMLTPADE